MICENIFICSLNIAKNISDFFFNYVNSKIKYQKINSTKNKKKNNFFPKMNFFVIGMLIMQAARLACGTCVFESEYGFILNCNFKKSGLFRVRNLGGLKAHFGLGLSLGDELGFAESLSNVESGRRRAISFKNGPPPNLVGVLPATQQAPSQHPIPDKRITSRSTGTLPYNAAAYKEALKRQKAAQSLPPPVPLMTEARPLPMGVPAFRPISKATAATAATVQVAQRRTNNVAVVDTTQPRISVNNKLVDSYSEPVHANRTFHVANPTVSQPIAVPAFQAMPNSISKIAEATRDKPQYQQSPTMAMAPSQFAEARITNKHPNYLQFEEPKFDLKDVTVEELATAANVSIDTIKHAIYVREQQLKAEHRAMLAAKLREEFVRTSTTTSTSTTTTTTTTTPKPPMAYFDVALPTIQYQQQSQYTQQNNVAHENKVSKVMNAPKEYYPVGYDKNFDDNFKSKVDLPPTSFACGKQKHFPGLYADTDLGCMVFHVCALTDDGLVRKSFLCPESTLFDQTILKCNWWFYVDCNSSKSVYDSNIPISKSYQLMKSLTYFSKYSKNKDSGDVGLDIQTLKKSMEGAQRKLDEVQAKAEAEADSRSSKTNDVNPNEAEAVQRTNEA